MNVKYYLSSLLVLSMCWSCSNISDSAKGVETSYFPIKEFVEAKIPVIEGKTLRKEININGKNETTTDIPNAEEWLKELDFFLQADINKAVLANAYETERSEKFLIHELKEGEKGKVKKLVIQYLNGEVKQISFNALTKNPFYSSKTRGVLVLHSETREIDQYTIENIQEVVFSKPNKLVISATVH